MSDDDDHEELVSKIRSNGPPKPMPRPPTTNEPWPTDAFQDALSGGRSDGMVDEGLGYRPGMKIWHAQLGAGRVVTVGRGLSDTLTVDFPDIGEMNVRADFVSPYDG